MKQVRFNYIEGKTQYSIYLGQANTIAEAMQVFISKSEDIDLLVNGDIFFDNKKIN